MLKSKLESKLEIYNSELDELLHDPTMRDMCFTSCGCNNRATQHKLTAYRNKIGVLGDKIRVIKLALKIVNKESFTNQDILNIYTDFLQVRNPELSWELYGEILSFNLIKKVMTLVIDLFLPCYKKQVLSIGLIFENARGQLFDVSLIEQQNIITGRSIMV